MLTLEDFKAKYPDLYRAVFDEGSKAGYDDGFAKGEAAGIEKGRAEGIAEAKAEGAKVERERIQSIEAQLIPGHEKLIQDLKFDGQTTGEQAAVKILAAEKQIRITTLQTLDEDAPPPVTTVIIPEVESTASLPEGPDKWKAEYEKSPELQAEFRSLEYYVAYKKGVAEDRVRIFGKKAS